MSELSAWTGTGGWDEGEEGFYDSGLPIPPANVIFDGTRPADGEEDPA